MNEAEDWETRFIHRILRPAKYEPEVQKRLSRMKGELFLDIGANVGLYSILLAPRFRKVIAVEPNPQAALELETRLTTKDIGNVTVMQCAISDSDGEAMLYLDETPRRLSGSADTLEAVFEYKPASNLNVNITFQSKQNLLVKTMTLDSLLQNQNWQGKVDLVKVDVEGAEFRLLRGAKKTLKNVKRLLVELHDRDRKHELEKILTSNGFKLEWIDKDHLLGQSLR